MGDDLGTGILEKGFDRHSLVHRGAQLPANAVEGGETVFEIVRQGIHLDVLAEVLFREQLLEGL